MSDNESDLLAREVDEELRREAFTRVWKRYGVYIIAAAALIILIVGGRQFWQAQVVAKRKAQSDIFLSVADAVQDGQGTDIASTVSLWQQAADDLDGSYKILAEMRLAAEKLDAGDVEGALADYDRLSRLGSVDEFIREMARLLGAMVVANELEDYQAALERLSLVRASNRPISYTARELQAFLYLKLARLSDALELFEALSLDSDAPQGLQSRAILMRDALSARLADRPVSDSPSPSGEQTDPVDDTNPVEGTNSIKDRTNDAQDAGSSDPSSQSQGKQDKTEGSSNDA